MRRARALTRDERKRTIIHVFADQIRRGRPAQLTCAGLAQMMDIRPSTKLRQILAEMVADELLVTVREDNAGVCGFRLVYELNYAKPGYSEPHENRHAVKQERAIRLNMSGKTELLVMS